MREGLSVVVPVYNSAKMLPELSERLRKVANELRICYEIIFVDDGSQDGSWSVIESLSNNGGTVRGIRLMRNFGQHNACLVGIRMAAYGLIMTMDDDLQHPPEEIPKILAKLDAGVDVVYAQPLREQHGIFRDLASIVTKFALRAAVGASNASKVSAWRLFRSTIRCAFEDFKAPLVNIDVLLTWGTKRFSSVKVSHAIRAYGESNYTFGMLVRHSFNMMTGFSVVPLQFASLLGFFFTIFGLVILLFVLVRFAISGSAVQGFPFLASSIAVFSGAQLFCLGIMGEYLARMHLRIMERPQYLVSETSGASRLIDVRESSSNAKPMESL